MSAGARGRGPRAQPAALEHLQLRSHVSFAIVNGRAVFLDILRDRYFALDPEAEAAFARACAGAMPGRQDPAFARLVATELFTLGPEPDPPVPAKVEIPLKGLERAGGRSRLHLLDLPEIWWFLSRSRRALKSRLLNEIIGAVDKARGKATMPVGAATTAELAQRFREARALVGIEPSCLQDSLALGLWLARRSARPTIVFGVKLDPFGAHCWVQTDSAILNDAPDVVAEFTPILVFS